MHECLLLYDTALDLLAQEERAVAQENEDILDDLVAQRTTIMQTAWEKRAGCPAALVMEKLEAIQRKQARIEREADKKLELVRLSLQSSRKENTRLSGYGKVVSHRQSALIVSKEG